MAGFRAAAGQIVKKIYAPLNTPHVAPYLAQVIMRTEKQGSRILDAIVDRIPAVSQEATWTWWNKP